MDSLDARLRRVRRRGRKILIPFVMGGDPSLRATTQVLLALQDVGADCIEVGIPFSDPLADGPVIQAASARALARGATPAGVLGAVAAAGRRLSTPIVCLSYWNPIVQYGGHEDTAPRAFLRAAREHGISGLVVPDLPAEEGQALRVAAAREQMAAIFLAAPTSPPHRLRLIVRASTGFIYYVSVTGTTGVRRQLPADLTRGVRQLKRLTTKPVCVGFGISTPQQAASVARVADGVIVGSALVRAMDDAGSVRGAVRAAARFVRRLRRVV